MNLQLPNSNWVPFVLAAFVMMGVNLPAQSLPPPEFLPVIWQTSPTSNTTVETASGLLIKTAGDTGWNADGVSTQRILGDGAVEFPSVVDGDLTAAFAVGLTLVDSHRTLASLDFGIRMTPVANSNPYRTTAQAYHNGALITGKTASCTSSSKLSITRVGSLISYLKDGVPFHSVKVNTSGQLFVDCCIYTEGKRIAACTINTGDLDKDSIPDAWEKQHLPPNSSWTDLLSFLDEPASIPVPGQPLISRPGDPDADGVSNRQEFLDGTNPNSSLSHMTPVNWTSLPANTEIVPGGVGGLRKKSGAGAGNAGGISSQKIIEDGQFTFKAPFGSTLAVGLGDYDLDQSQADLDFAFILDGANSTVTIKRPSPETSISAGQYTPETVFCIQRVSGRVQFLKDGVVHASSTTPTSGPLQVDCSLSVSNSQITECRIYTGDLDGDLLPDSWEISHFEELPPQSALTDIERLEGFAPLEDQDGDLRSNLAEWIDGTNPSNPHSVSKPITWSPSSPDITTSVGSVAPVTKNNGASNSADAIGILNGNELRILHSGTIVFNFQPASSMAVGLTLVNTSRALSDLEYAISVNASGQAIAYAPSTQKALGSYNAATTFSIQRLDRQIAFLKDGIVYHTSTVPISASLLVDSSFNTVNSAITSARIHTGDIDGDKLPDDWEIAVLKRRGDEPTFANLQNVVQPTGNLDSDTFTNLQEYRFGTDPLHEVSKPYIQTWDDRFFTNATIWGTEGGLIKNGTTAGYNTKAWGRLPIPHDDDGGLAFRVSPTGTLAVGLSQNGANDAGKDTIEYAFILTSTGATIQCPETTTGVPSDTYTSDTLFMIRRKQGHVEFLRDGVVVYTSTTPVSDNLTADCSISTIGHKLDAAYQLLDDRDYDGMPDSWELQFLPLDSTITNLNTFRYDMDWGDGDGVTNLLEYQNGTSPSSDDTDEDDMPDLWEIQYGLAANDRSNATTDLDGDGLSNWQEHEEQTLPNNPDTDDDGMWDGFEFASQLDPLNPNDAMWDSDGDRIPNVWEFQRGTNSNLATDTPPADAVVDTTISDAEIGGTTFKTLQQAYASLSSKPAHYRAVIAFKPGIHHGVSFDHSSTLKRHVALLGNLAATAGDQTQVTILSDLDLRLTLDTVLDGLIMEKGEGISMGPDPLLVPNRVRITNCLMRFFGSSWQVGDPTEGGAIRNQGGTLLIGHSTFFRCNRNASLPSTPCSISNTEYGGTVSIWNSIIWDPSLVSASVPVLGAPGTLIFQNSLIQNGTGGVPIANPKLNGLGLVTRESTTCLGSAIPADTPKDIYGNIRPSAGIDLGPVQLVPNQKDTDGDGMTDGWETQFGFNPNDAADGEMDFDRDGITNLREYRTYPQTNPKDLIDPASDLIDSDADGYSDYAEFIWETNPTNPESQPNSGFGINVYSAHAWYAASVSTKSYQPGHQTTWDLIQTNPYSTSDKWTKTSTNIPPLPGRLAPFANDIEFDWEMRDPLVIYGPSINGEVLAYYSNATKDYPTQPSIHDSWEMSPLRISLTTQSRRHAATSRTYLIFARGGQSDPFSNHYDPDELQVYPVTVDIGTNKTEGTPVSFIPPVPDLNRALTIDTLIPMDLKAYPLLPEGSVLNSASQVQTSLPSPEFNSTSCSVENIRYTSSGELVGDITVSGDLTSKACDVTKGPLGTINKAQLFVNGSQEPAGEIDVTVNKQTTGPRERPYPFSGEFDQVITNVPLTEGINTLRLSAQDKVHGIPGYSSWTVEINVSEPGSFLTTVQTGFDLAIQLPPSTPLSEIEAIVVSGTVDSVVWQSQTFTRTTAQQGHRFDSTVNGTPVQIEILQEEFLVAGLLNINFSMGTSPGAPAPLVLRESSPGSSLYHIRLAPYSVLPINGTVPEHITVNDPTLIEESTEGEFYPYVLGLELPPETPEDAQLYIEVQGSRYQLRKDQTSDTWLLHGNEIVAGAQAVSELNPLVVSMRAPEESDPLPENEEDPLITSLQDATFVEGFVKGLGAGGVDMVTGTGQVIGGAIKYVGRGLLTFGCQVRFVGQFVTGQDTQFTMDMMLELSAPNQEVHQQIGAIAQGLLPVAEWALNNAENLAELEIALLTGNIDGVNSAFLRASDLNGTLFSMGAEAIAGTLAEYENDPPGVKGYKVGRVAFELATIILPFTKPGQLVHLKKAEVLTKLLQRNVVDSGTAAKLTTLKTALTTTKMCFVASTLVLCHVEGASRMEPIGGLESLASAHPDLKVWARDEFTGTEGWKRPIAWFTTHPQELCHLSYDVDGDGQSDETLTGTAPHPFWMVGQEQFVPMGDLKTGDVLTTTSGKSVTVTSNSRQRAPPGETFTTYNFEVADFHTYFVGKSNVWVHNDGKSPCDEVFSAFYSLTDKATSPFHGEPWKAFDDVAKTMGKDRNSAIFGWAADEVMRKQLKDLPLPQRVTQWPSHAQVKATMRQVKGPGSEVDLGGTRFGEIAVPEWVKQNRIDLGSIKSFTLESHHGVPKKVQEWLGMTKDKDSVPAYLTTMLEHRGAEVGIHQRLAQKMGDKIGSGPVNLDQTKPAALTNDLIKEALQETYEEFGIEHFWEVCEHWIETP